jgi:uncharacterized membrane protein YraQ (UPF0718 family)/copper chaperone CopZ
LPTFAHQFLLEFVRVFGELAPWLLFGALVAALMHYFLPESLIKRQLKGYSGVAKAVGLGVPLPLCSCGVIPAGVGLKNDGASNGSVIGFLISTPQTGIDSIMVTTSFLGLPFAIFKVASAAITGLVGGAISQALSEPDENEVRSPMTEMHTKRRTFRDFFGYAEMVLQSIWRWLLFGVVASSLIGTLIPPNALDNTMFANDILASIAVLAISVPLYVCATSSVPIAAALVTAGLPVGSALVFLMAGPATNVATIGAVYKTLGGRNLAIYLSTIIIFSLGLGLTFDTYFSTLGAVSAHHHGESSGFTAISSVILGLLMVRFLITDLIAARTAKIMASEPGTALIVGVKGMTCGGCSTGLQRKLSEAPDILTAYVDLATDSATVTGAITMEDLSELVSQAGYTPFEFDASK